LRPRIQGGARCAILKLCGSVRRGHESALPLPGRDRWPGPPPLPEADGRSSPHQGLPEAWSRLTLTGSRLQSSLPDRVDARKLFAYYKELVTAENPGRLDHMGSQPSLRERKKEKTRQLIGETAHRLFIERGFDAVTVAEVAREADVSEGTVFNYFPTKEELFYSGMEAFEARLIAAVRERPKGDSVLSAFRRFVLDGTARLGSQEAAETIATAARIIAASRALQAREREVVAEYTNELAALIADEPRTRAHGVEAWTVANALMGVQRALVAHVRAAVLAGRRGRTLATEARAEGRRAFARLERGFADFAVKR
jgi:AcrR family transcriptional regulator